MKNLKLLYRRSLKYEETKTELLVHHPLEDISFIYSGNVVKLINHQNGEIKELCTYDEVIAMEYIQINDCLCLATSSGEILNHNLLSGENEAVGLINDGIEAMSWSPDQELIVFVTK